MKIREINERLQGLKSINSVVDNIDFALGLVDIEEMLQKESDKAQKAIQKTAQLNEAETEYYNAFFTQNIRDKNDDELFNAVSNKLKKANEILDRDVKLTYSKLNKKDCPKNMNMEQFRALRVFLK